MQWHRNGDRGISDLVARRESATCSRGIALPGSPPLQEADGTSGVTFASTGAWEPSALTKTLVTGSGGFLGRHLIEGLRNEGVQAMEIKNRSDCDLRRSRPVLERVHKLRPKYIVHLAASPDTKGSLISPSNGFFNTIACTLNLVRAARKTGTQLLVNVGSYKQYGCCANPFRESQRVRPRSAYALAKQLSESFLLASQTPTFRVVCLRLGPLFGPHQHPRYLVAHAITSLLADKTRCLTASTVRWDALYVQDAVNAILRALATASAAGQVINVSGGIARTPYDIMCIIAELLRVKANITKAHAQHGDWHCFGSIQRAQRLLKWNPSVPLESGLRLTIQSYERLANNIGLTHGSIRCAP